MKKKIISLKNEKSAILTIEKQDECCYIWAHDKNFNRIGFCQFSIYKKYSKRLDEEKRVLFAKKHKTSLEKVPYELNICVSEKNATLKNEELLLKKDFVINGEILTLSNGNQYQFKNNMCELARIEILDEDFFKVGLGTSMFKLMEKYIKQKKCTEIEAFYLPNGRFQSGTHDFYVRNGFSFGYKKGHTCANKSLSKTSEKEKTNF